MNNKLLATVALAATVLGSPAQAIEDDIYPPDLNQVLVNCVFSPLSDASKVLAVPTGSPLQAVSRGTTINTKFNLVHSGQISRTLRLINGTSLYSVKMNAWRIVRDLPFEKSDCLTKMRWPSTGYAMSACQANSMDSGQLYFFYRTADGVFIDSSPYNEAPVGVPGGTDKGFLTMTSNNLVMNRLWYAMYDISPPDRSLQIFKISECENRNGTPLSPVQFHPFYYWYY